MDGNMAGPTSDGVVVGGGVAPHRQPCTSFVTLPHAFPNCVTYPSNCSESLELCFKSLQLAPCGFHGPKYLRSFPPSPHCADQWPAPGAPSLFPTTFPALNHETRQQKHYNANASFLLLGRLSYQVLHSLRSYLFGNSTDQINSKTQSCRTGRNSSAGSGSQNYTRSQLQRLATRLLRPSSSCFLVATRSQQLLYS